MPGRLHPPLQPPKKFPSIVQPGTKRPSTRRAVLLSVGGGGTIPKGNPSGEDFVYNQCIGDGKSSCIWPNPTIASVIIDNTLPARSGYSLPSNFGPVFSAGATKMQGPSKTNPCSPTATGGAITVNGPYVCAQATQEALGLPGDETSMTGGSWVLVDMDTRTVVAVLQGSSNTVPSQVGSAIQSHAHTGGVDSMGNTMPGPIGLSQLNPMPTNAGPIVNDFTGFTPVSGVGYTSFDVETAFSLDQDIDSDWVGGVLVYLVPEGGLPPIDHQKAHMVLPPSIDGTYTPVITDVPAFRDNGWDVYVSYIDTAENISLPTFVGTITPQVLATPVLAGAPTFDYIDAGNVSFDVSFDVQLDVNPSWEREILIYLVRHGGAVPDWQTTVHTRFPSVASGYYTVNLKNVASGVAGGWDVYAAQTDLRSTISTPTLLGTMASNPSALAGYVGTLSKTIDAEGDILNVEFPGTAISPTGGLIHVNSVTSSMAYPLVAGQLVELSVELTRAP